MERCPGCGVVLRETEWPAADNHAASRSCWSRYGELASWSQALGDRDFLHQHVVDAYAAQHAGPPSKPITVFFALLGLQLACEKGFSGREVQRAHMELAKVKRPWPVFEVPAQPAQMTIADVLAAADREQAVMRWAQAVWASWSAQHDVVRKQVGAWLSQ
jgi:hypothetical protein